jgi:tetratricopeptide (TPR) repeat protein
LPGIIVNLREIGLLQTDEADNFWMHNIVRNSLKPVEPRTIKQAHLRAMNYYCSLKVNLLPQSIDDCANLLEWHHHAVGASDSASAYKALYSTSLESQLLKWNAYDLLAQLCEQTLAIAGTENNKLSNVERVHIHRTLGTVYFYVGDISNSIAYLRSAVDLLQSDEAQELRIALMIELSESYNSNHDFGPAMEICNKAIRLLSVWPNENLQAKVIHLKGIINRDRGEAGEAISDLESAIKLYDDLNDLTHLGNATIDLGNVYFFQNQFTKAVANYERALNFFESVGDIRGIIIARFNIADFMLQNEQYQPAVNKIQPAVDIARQKKFTTLELRAGLILIEAQIALLNLDEAERELARLSPLIIKWASPCISGQELVLLAYKHAKLSQPEQAMTCFNHAFELLENPDCQYEYAHGTLLFAGFLKEQGELEKARDILSRASNVFAQMNSQLGLQAVQKMLAGSLDK